MTYNDKLFKVQSVDNPTQQNISTSYVEVTGSKVFLDFKKSTANIFYKFNFYTSRVWVNASNYDVTMLHVKLQKSNDDFSSNIVDIPGCEFNFSGDTQQQDSFFSVCSPFFIIENLDRKYLRIVVRAYSTANDSILHRTEYWTGGTDGVPNIYYNPTLIVGEI